MHSGIHIMAFNYEDAGGFKMSSAPRPASLLADMEFCSKIAFAHAYDVTSATPCSFLFSELQMVEMKENPQFYFLNFSVIT